MTQPTLYKVILPVRSKEDWDAVLDWLFDNNRLNHYVNAYYHEEKRKPHMVVVLNNRDTALLLKLSLA